MSERLVDRVTKAVRQVAVEIERLFTIARPASGAVVAGNARRGLVRPRHPRMIAGVCSGIAEAYGWDLSVVRLVVLVLAVASSGLVAAGYLVAWVLIPEARYELPERTGRTAETSAS